MNEDIKRAQKIVFFIKWKKNLPSYFPLWASSLAHEQIKLLPVTEREFLQLENRHRCIVIGVTRNLGERKCLFRFKRRYLNFVLLTKNVLFFDVTSFSEFEDKYKFLTMKSYIYTPLPMSISQLTEEISDRVFSFYKENNRWPGGKKKGLPIKLNSEVKL